jgi:hypothetical protein
MVSQYLDTFVSLRPSGATITKHHNNRVSGRPYPTHFCIANNRSFLGDDLVRYLSYNDSMLELTAMLVQGTLYFLLSFLLFSSVCPCITACKAAM